MKQLSYWNGELIPSDGLSVSVFDIGFLQGVTVSEQLRTFGGRLFQLDEHMQRLKHSLQIIGVVNLNLDALQHEAQTLASHNHSLLEPGDDLGLTIFVTPGRDSAAAMSESPGPNVGMYTVPIPFFRWAERYTAGESVVISTVRQVPDNCWPTALKCRSRMHYFLADRAARLQDPNARAVLLDQDGNIAEASTASVLAYRRDEGFVAPVAAKVLPSVSVGVLKSLAKGLNIEFVHRDMTPHDVITADEVFLCSTSPCLIPVTAVDESAIGEGIPGPVFKKTMDAWSTLAGVEVIAQARNFAVR